ncbi:voltage-dependent anion channel-domain-containing protein [Annulohypoxylon maeteangense]|uniref:voltage-dependent anion channel-domain-containing protein n=1 Tax=Annulohypoxylon maeteangense TaxID=1927788 RepID=UPI002007FD97|nr:voltage-dependent anion channel-domain-containing protein [Annulohypoxylon maeteangense]KAI0885031.1 voltage-dependent anion channel-domain-containing protein [Annulohypoxylon maeteangense]
MSRVISSQIDVEAALNGYVTPGEDYFTRGGSPVLSVSHRERQKRPPPIPFFPQPNPDSLARMISNARKHKGGQKIGIRDRICCHQWTWFTMTMATGGVANVFYSIWTPYQADWLWYIGLIFFLFNVCLFIMNCVLITMRFIMVPGSFMHSFLDQMESLFIPSVVVSAATILINACQYGIPMTGPWLQHTMEWLFWIYIVISVLASSGMYLILWSTQIFPIHTMTPVWVFPGYPLLLTAPFASSLISANSVASDNPPINRLAIGMCAIAVQGTGFLISFMICAAFIYRLMTQKLPRDEQRPGVFISIGPSGFTVAGLVSLGQQANVVIPDSFQGSTHSVIILRLLSTIIGIWLWGLSIWFFLVSVGSLWKYVRPERKMPFQMTWWSFVFPNTALVTATLALATALGSNGFRICGCVMAAILIVVWALVFIRMMRCLWNRELLWPKGLEEE